jgi:outer membrane murein-binding lipoprotein Lpp
MNRFSRWAVVLTVVLVAGCVNIAPIQNVDNAPVVSAAGKPLTQAQVREAILRAALPGIGT